MRTFRPGATVAFLAIVMLISLLLAGCGNDASTAADTTRAPTATAAADAGDATMSTAAHAPADTTAGGATGSPRPVTFTTEDGVTLGGHLFGSGHNGVILAHMYPADQTSWFATARRLADAGYLVLTFDFRGYGESGGEKQIDVIDQDVSAAIAAIRQQGAAQVVLAGASMGGTASLIAGDRAQLLSSIRLAGVATLSAPVEFQGLSAADAVPRIIVPLLLIAAEEDAGAAGARELEQLSSGKGRLEIVPGSDHGTDLMTGSQADSVYALLEDFIETSFAP